MGLLAELPENKKIFYCRTQKYHYVKDDEGAMKQIVSKNVCRTIRDDNLKFIKRLSKLGKPLSAALKSGF